MKSILIIFILFLSIFSNAGTRSTKFSNPYEILNISPQATMEEIKSAYRRLAKELHPDRNPGDKVKEERFKNVNAAYEQIQEIRENGMGFDNGNNFNNNTYSTNGNYQGPFDFNDDVSYKGQIILKTLERLNRIGENGWGYEASYYNFGYVLRPAFELSNITSAVIDTIKLVENKSYLDPNIISVAIYELKNISLKYDDIRLSTNGVYNLIASFYLNSLLQLLKVYSHPIMLSSSNTAAGKIENFLLKAIHKMSGSSQLKKVDELQRQVDHYIALGWEHFLSLDHKSKTSIPLNLNFVMPRYQDVANFIVFNRNEIKPQILPQFLKYLKSMKMDMVEVYKLIAAGLIFQSRNSQNLIGSTIPRGLLSLEEIQALEVFIEKLPEDIQNEVSVIMTVIKDVNYEIQSGRNNMGAIQSKISQLMESLQKRDFSKLNCKEFFR